MTLEEEIMKLDLIASDAFEGGDANEFRQLAEWLRELKAYRERDFCHYCGERDTLFFDEPCKSCKIYFDRREVNADE